MQKKEGYQRKGEIMAGECSIGSSKNTCHGMLKWSIALGAVIWGNDTAVCWQCTQERAGGREDTDF